ncbi:MAG TPA: hypothetical protein VFJ52_00505 [Terriglobia bacterium]|nr:hypothetical protein [Terriglobia bacterium]
MSHYARKQDSNARVVIDAFEAAGCSVLVITSTRPGCPDLAVGVSGRTHLVEVKPDVNVTARRNLRPTQVAFADSWRGGPVHVVRSANEAFQLAGLLRMTAKPKEAP